MKPAVRQLLDTPAPGVDRRSFFKTLGVTAAGALAMSREAAADAEGAGHPLGDSVASVLGVPLVVEGRAIVTFDLDPKYSELIRTDATAVATGCGCGACSVMAQVHPASRTPVPGPVENRAKSAPVDGRWPAADSATWPTRRSTRFRDLRRSRLL